MTQNTMSPYEQNQVARMNLLATGISMVKRLQPVKGQFGDQLKIPLLRMGIMTGVMLQFTVPVTIAESAAVPSLVSPYNIAQTVIYNDFAGVQRTRTNGYQLWAAQSMKQGDAISVIPNSAFAGGNGPLLNYDTNITNIPTAVGEGEIKFSLYVPMAYDPGSDLTGSILTQTNVGEHYVTIQLANALKHADPWIGAYTGGGDVTTTGVTVEAFQYYIQPQSMGIESLPVLDLSTVYGFEGGYQNTANIASGQATYINYPNNRSILSTLISFENGGAFTADGADLDLITLVANSNTNFKEMTPRLVRETMRNMINADLAAGQYFLSSRAQPILTQLYANVQAKMDVKEAKAGVTQMVSQFEVQYPSGSPLPGITVAA